MQMVQCGYDAVASQNENKTNKTPEKVEVILHTVRTRISKTVLL